MYASPLPPIPPFPGPSLLGEARGRLPLGAIVRVRVSRLLLPARPFYGVRGVIA